MEQPNIIPQRTEIWKRLRLGKITSSSIYLFMGAKGPINNASEKYMHKLLMQLLVGMEPEIKAYQLAHGVEWEPFAKQQVANKHQSEYFEADFIQNPSLRYHGGSPDGLICIGGIDTTPEIKAPVFEEALINRKLFKSVEACKKGYPEIYYQCQSNMYLQKTCQALAVSFHAGLPEPLRLSELIIPYNDSEVKLMLSNIAEAWDWMQKESRELGLDIEAAYKEYAQPVQGVGTPLVIPESHFGTAA